MPAPAFLGIQEFPATLSSAMWGSTAYRKPRKARRGQEASAASRQLWTTPPDLVAAVNTSLQHPLPFPALLLRDWGWVS